MNCVIIGGGVSGFQAAFACRKRWPDKSVTLIDAEKEVGYYRTLLPQFMVGTIAESKLFFWRREDDPGLNVRTGVAVQAVDRKNQTLALEDGETLSYDGLILACGGRPIIPPICPEDACEGVFPVRNLTAARRVKKWLPDHRHVVVLGGGLVGVKTAAHLAHDGLRVTVVEKEDTLLPQALSCSAASLVQTHLQNLGIQLMLGCSVEDVQAAGGRLKAVRAGNSWIPCETLLVAAGSVPDVTFLEGSGLLEDGKLVVSPNLQTLDDKIFAAGDAVFIQKEDDVTPWTWPQAVCQGKHAAANLCNPTPIPLTVFSRVNAMNLFGLSLTILGAPMPGCEVMTYGRPDHGLYRELFIFDDRIVGGALVGDISRAGLLHGWMVSGRKIDTTDPDLLKPQVRAFSRRSWEAVDQIQRACFISAK